MAIEHEKIREALTYVMEPDLKKDIVALGLVSDIKAEGNVVSFVVKVNNPAMHSRKRMEDACIHQVKRFLGDDVDVRPDVQALPKTTEREPEQRKVLPGVKHIIAIASGKGGVGKSTVTANLAAGLAAKGFKVGVIDADIYGPSIPMMFDLVREKPYVQKIDGETVMVPPDNYGVKVMSIGFFADINQAVVWRGPMASKALTQMINDVHWGELDYMFIDLPPGTGDVHLTIVQSTPLSGAIVVSTPQEVALADARKGVAMFLLPNINIPVLGLIENMAWFTPEELPDNKYYIFGKDGVRNLAEELKVPLLGQVPLVQSIREAGDVGRPAVLQESTPQAQAFSALVDQLSARMALLG